MSSGVGKHGTRGSGVAESGAAVDVGDHDEPTILLPAISDLLVAAAVSVLVGTGALIIGLVGPHAGRFAGRYTVSLGIWIVGMGALVIWSDHGLLKSVNLVRTPVVEERSTSWLVRALQKLGFDALVVAFAVLISRPELIAFVLGNGVLSAGTALRWRRGEKQHHESLLRSRGWRSRKLYSSTAR